MYINTYVTYVNMRAQMQIKYLFRRQSGYRAKRFHFATEYCMRIYCC